MRISIHTLGTRGDVQPYLALAKGLVQSGHDVQLTAPEQFASMAYERRVAFAPLPREFLAVLESPEAKAILGRSSAGFGAGLKLLKFYREIGRRLLDAEWNAAREFSPQAIIFHPKTLGAPHIAAKLEIPLLLASPLPGFTPTTEFPTPVLPVASLGPFNRLSHALMIHGGSILFSKTIRAWRAEALALPDRRKASPLAGTLYAYSSHVLPKPSDWGSDIIVTGYWFLETKDWSPPDTLAQFLAAGEPPVYVGFGSMPGSSPERLTGLVLEGLRRAGKRGLLATAGGALATSASNEYVHVIAEAPHDRLLPFVSATLHHGGAGTTGAALRAGRPTAICPFIGDQSFWARRANALGVGPKPLDKRTMTVDDLASAFMAMDNPAMRSRAAELGAAIRAEKGVEQAVDFINDRLSEPRTTGIGR